MHFLSMIGAQSCYFSGAARSIRQLGLTLVEVMIVVAILGLVLAGALPAYEESLIRAKISEGLGLAAPYKDLVAQNSLAGRALNANAPTVSGTSPVQAIAVATDGVITVSFKPEGFGATSAAKLVGGPTVTLVPTMNGSPLNKPTTKLSPNGVGLASSAVVEWRCATESSTLTAGPRGTLPSQLAPSECR
jgi:type IV pilus assembly protein PilA